MLIVEHYAAGNKDVGRLPRGEPDRWVALSEETLTLEVLVSLPVDHVPLAVLVLFLLIK